MERTLDRRRTIQAGLVAMATARLGGFQQPVAAQTPTATITGNLIDVGGRSLYLERGGGGEPTVLFESGFGNNAQIWDSIALPPDSGETAVLPGVAAFTTVCAYDRPGTILDLEHRSRSDPVPMPRTAVDVVTDLYALLQAAEVPGPYVLVGHSFGGIVVRLYAATYPEDVIGMVLVDAGDEEMHTRLRAAMTVDQWALYEQLSSEPSPEVATYADRERMDLDASFDQLREAAAAQPLPPMPLVVLSHGLSPFGADAASQLPPDFPIDAIEPAWQEGQAALAALLPDARHLIATQSGHYIQLDEPGLVIDAIRQVVEAVRDPTAWQGDPA
jgi:pimeloyl-ACP methyl ester carboxylesterase